MVSTAGWSVSIPAAQRLSLSPLSHSEPATFLWGKVIIQYHNRICACLDAMWKVNFGWKSDFLMLSHCSAAHTSKIRKTHRPAAGSWVFCWVCLFWAVNVFYIINRWLAPSSWDDLRVRSLDSKGQKHFSPARWHIKWASCHSHCLSDIKIISVLKEQSRIESFASSVVPGCSLVLNTFLD